MPPLSEVLVVDGRDNTFEIREFLSRLDQPYRVVDFGASEAQVAGDLPAVVIGDAMLRRPSLVQIAEALGVRYPPKRSVYDVAIIGGGPAGLAAAVHAASDGLATCVIESSAPGGQASYTTRIENYFGIDPLAGPMTGAHLARIGGRQAEAFGAELLVLRGAEEIRRDPGDDHYRVRLQTGEEFDALTVLAASGIEWRRLDAEGVEAFVGHGVYYGAGPGEGARHRGAAVIVVGGANSAGQAALNFAANGARVTVACRGAQLSETMSSYLRDRVAATDAIEVRLSTEVVSVSGDTALREVQFDDGETREIEAMFVAIGGRPRTDWSSRINLARDELGYIKTDVEVISGGPNRRRLPLETSAPGVFAAGDVRRSSTKRVAAAVGEGAAAVGSIHRYLAAVGAA